MDLLDQDKFNLFFSDYINGPVRLIQPNRTLSSSLSLKRFIVKARNFSRMIQAKALDQVDPKEQFFSNLVRQLLQVFFGAAAELNMMNHKAIVTLFRGKVKGQAGLEFPRDCTAFCNKNSDRFLRFAGTVKCLVNL